MTQQLHQNTLDAAEEGATSGFYVNFLDMKLEQLENVGEVRKEEGTTSEKLNVKCLDIHFFNTDLLVFKILLQNPEDLGIVPALQSPYDRGKYSK